VFEENGEVIVLMGLQVAFGRYAGKATLANNYGRVVFEDGVSGLFLFSDMYPITQIDKVKRVIDEKMSAIIETHNDAIKLSTHTYQVLQKKMEAMNG